MRENFQVAFYEMTQASLVARKLGRNRKEAEEVGSIANPFDGHHIVLNRRSSLLHS